MSHTAQGKARAAAKCASAGIHHESLLGCILGAQRERQDEDAVPCFPVAPPPPHARLLAHAGGHKAPAPRDGQAVDKATRGEPAQLAEALGPLGALVQAPQANQAVPGSSCLRGEGEQGGEIV